jgi:hypothetical protein
MSHPEDTTSHMVPLLPVEVTKVVPIDDEETGILGATIVLQLRQPISQTNAVTAHCLIRLY